VSKEGFSASALVRWAQVNKIHGERRMMTVLSQEAGTVKATLNTVGDVRVKETWIYLWV